MFEAAKYELNKNLKSYLDMVLTIAEKFASDNKLEFKEIDTSEDNKRYLKSYGSNPFQSIKEQFTISDIHYRIEQDMKWKPTGRKTYFVEAIHLVATKKDVNTYSGETFDSYEIPYDEVKRNSKYILEIFKTQHKIKNPLVDKIKEWFDKNINTSLGISVKLDLKKLIFTIMEKVFSQLN